MIDNMVLENETANNTEVTNESVEEKYINHLTFGTKIEETDEYVEIVTEAAGYNRDNLEITVENSELRVANKAEVTHQGDVILKEYRDTVYRRLYKLSDKISTEGITAEVKNGVLKIRLPKTPPAKKRRIEVKAV